jgi:hypothetical protein
MVNRRRIEPVDYGAQRGRPAKGSIIETAPALCTSCGAPIDSQYFDESSVVAAPNPGETVTLAQFDLPPQYCGVLEYFAQFTDQYGQDNSLIETDGVEWLILADGSPLFPYLRLDRIVNPWGVGAFPVAVRLQEDTKIKMVARGVAKRGIDDHGFPLTRVGGRLVGRFWYNAAYGDALRRRY